MSASLMSGPLRLGAVSVLALLLAGCTTLSSDGGFGAVAQTTQERTGLSTRLLRNDDDRRALDALLRDKLKQPLSADDAVQVALLNNRGLQATYWSLGVAEADLVQAGRLQNPAFGFKRMHDGESVAIERTLTVNLVNLITAPLASRIEARRFEQTRLAVSAAALTVASDTRSAWVEAVAAGQSVAYALQVSEAADASAELANRMQLAGNWSKLDLAREQAFYAETAAELARARKQANASREKLTRLMGLWGEQLHYALPERLPDLPAAPHELADVEQTALRERLDIRAATLDTQHTASSLGLTRATRLLNVLELGGVRESGGARGYELTLEIPLFDWGTARTARAEAVYMQSVNRLAEAAAHARSEARESYLDYRASYDLARHYRDNVIPLRRQISDETLLRYNGMLVSVFELLADAREQAGAVHAYIGALKDFWTAQGNLDRALGGTLPAAPNTNTAKPANNGDQP